MFYQSTLPTTSRFGGAWERERKKSIKNHLNEHFRHLDKFAYWKWQNDVAGFRTSAHKSIKFPNIKECLCDWVIFYSLHNIDSRPPACMWQKRTENVFWLFSPPRSFAFALQYNSNSHLFDNSNMDKFLKALFEFKRLSIKYFSITFSAAFFSLTGNSFVDRKQR